MSSSDSSASQHPIYMSTVSAPTNIACIKYWGKANVPLNTPINSSVSITLDQSDLRAVTTAAASKSFTSHRLWLNGTEEDVTNSRRFMACLEGVLGLARDQGKWDGMCLHVSSYNTFPTAAGLASSAAGYAALVFAFATLFDAVEEFPGQLSTFARQGSGSACRSLYGGFVAWRMGDLESNPAATDSLAEQVCDETHWPEIRALILVVDDAKKDTSSTAGMGTSVNTSKLLSYRAAHVVDGRMALIEQAFRTKDFAAFANVTMQDSNQFHATCLDTFPPIFYMNDISRSVIKVVHAYNDYHHEVRAGYTFDAGPNAVIYTLDEYTVELSALLLHFYPSDHSAEHHNNDDGYYSNPDMYHRAASHTLDPALIAAVEKTGRDAGKAGDIKKIYHTRSGPGPQVLDREEATIDPLTGLNTYQKS